MTNELTRPTLAQFSAGNLPESWRSSLSRRLESDETLLAWLELDLDAQLRFAAGLIAVTNRRLLAASDAETWQEWPLAADLTLLRRDHAGVGSLELRDAHALIARWRYTLGRDVSAKQVADHFERQIDGIRSGKPVIAPEETLCPVCKTPQTPGQDECPTCAKNVDAPPSTCTLFRL
ncbi:ABC transporter, partial [bacterium]|nr:ABC transporter [bacterium]